MNEHTQFLTDGHDGIVRRYEYDDETVLVVDFGFVEGTVDVVDGTVIVVTDDDQYELEVDDTVSATMNNGVLTIEVRS